MTTAPATLSIPGLPALSWRNQPAEASWDDQALTIVAGAKTDWFASPQGAPMSLNAPALLLPCAGPGLLSARVAPQFAATFDAGVLAIFQRERLWAKLCFELSPQGAPMVVSVVTRELSDDANSFTVDGREIYLRVARLERAFAMHASSDGRSWSMIRHFALDPEAEVWLGFLAQSPTGEACSVRFDQIAFESRLLADIRSGE